MKHPEDGDDIISIIIIIDLAIVSAVAETVLTWADWSLSYLLESQRNAVEIKQHVSRRRDYLRLTLFFFSF